LRQLAQYRDVDDKIRAAGADVAAVAVDPPERSEAVRRQLQLRFPILCDVGRKLVRDWGIFVPEQMGGIAQPAVFIIDRDRRVLFASVDREASRIPATTIVDLLQDAQTKSREAKRRFVLPHPSDWARAIGNAFRFGLRSPKV
jgi:peroxiredoxin